MTQKLVLWFCFLLVSCGTPSAQAQVSLPWPNESVESLIAVLQSGASTFEKAKACQQLAIVGDASAVESLANLVGDEKLSAYARTALENIPGLESEQALAKLAEELTGQQKLAAIQSLGKRSSRQKSSAAIRFLSRLLQTNDSDTKSAAAEALATIGTVASAESLLTEAKTADEKELRDLLGPTLNCVQSLAARGESEAANRICDALLSMKLPADLKQNTLLQKLMVVGEKAGDEQLLQMLESKEEAEFEAALLAARRLPGPIRIGKQLASTLEDQTVERQAAILRLIGDLGDQEALPGVINATKAESQEVKTAAVGAIARIGDSSCVPVITRILRESTGEERAKAIEAAIQLDHSRMDEAAVRMLTAESTHQKLAALEIVGAKKLSASFPVVKTLSNDSDARIKRQAIAVIGKVADADRLPELIRIGVDNFSGAEGEQWKQTLKFACQRMPTEKCASLLGRALDASDEDHIKVALLEQLAFVGGESALQKVVTAAKSNNPVMQDAASRLLGEWLTPDAAPPIFEILMQKQRSRFKTRLLRGYIRIARQLDMPTEDRIAVCENAMRLADRKAEKVLVLQALGRHPSQSGLDVAKRMLRDPELQNRATVTIQEIVKVIDPASQDEAGFVSLFDGKTLDGWNEFTPGFWRVENGAIVGGTLDEMVKQNEFLRSSKQWGDFELRLQFKLIGDKTNAGVQFRTAEIPGDHEVSGYQADLGDDWWGCLYDESRRNMVLAGPTKERRADPIKSQQWNDYHIVCRGNRIQLWINDVQTVDFTEEDETIPQSGIVALQVHGNMRMEAHYRNLRIKEFD